MSEALPPICILAGGLGTRLGPAAGGKPKALVEVAGRPFILHQLRLLADHGARDAVLCVSYRGEQIEAAVGTEQFGIKLSYSFDGAQQLGTLGAIQKARPLLGERFLVLYGDTYLRIDYVEAATRWRRSELPAMMTVLRNDGRWDVSNAIFRGGRVAVYDKRSPTPEMRWIDYGLGGLTQMALDQANDRTTDLADLYHGLAARGQLFGFEARERFYEIGTPAAMAETSRFLEAATRPDRQRHTANS